MWAKRLTFDAAYAEARTRRPTISPNPGFICQLLEWEQLLRLVRCVGCEGGSGSGVSLCVFCS